ncbi:pyruvate dehydrogenase [acetyl-transferring]-phosphatase 2, mitochondrial-like [Paramacrobiotus metropolitanus]|uniref:pyruvate dehydrogenase [acetyl-transferring]-phosphatase 2, mitochondrial-like n=1 Tax=Paramacrobiotus metropolitanus TaxID=2943436 RepID=UPI00244597D5|nr:pyruvate dehydrogenase [acetyl-transferring]-phosphatase 2, mitochondrial-like [Paramacrobiotus metropolitanus]
MLFTWIIPAGKQLLRTSYCYRRLHLQVPGGVRAKLTLQQINHILRLREATSADTECPPPIKTYEASQLAANFPIEDRCLEAKLLRTGGMLFAVIDGHGGPGCAQALSERLADYVSVALMDADSLQRLAGEIDSSANANSEFPIIVNRKLHPGDYIIPSQRSNHYRWLGRYVRDRVQSPPAVVDIPAQLKDAFLRLDQDISASGLETLDDNDEVVKNVSLENLSCCLSGAVVSMAYVNDCDLYMASTGDAMGIIASIDEEGIWSSQVLTAQHTHKNAQELQRLYEQHPGEESGVVVAERLLGQLYPLRAFGDCQYKWPAEQLKAILKHHMLMHMFPQNYHTPPYLTAEPEITYHRLHANNRFILLSSDGLFDFLNDESATKLVTEHMSGRRALQPFSVPPNSGATLAELNLRLKKRMIAQSKKPDDANVATHVIRHALGRSETGLDMNKLSRTLSASVEEARYQRDDMTVQIAFFDKDYLRLFSPMETGNRSKE